MTGPETVTFTVDSPAGPPSPFECVDIGILDDTVLEGDHEFTVIIIDTSDDAPINAMSSTTTVTILDDEGLKLTHMSTYHSESFIIAFDFAFIKLTSVLKEFTLYMQIKMSVNLIMVQDMYIILL